MNLHEKQYNDLLLKVLNEGLTKGDRTGTGTISLFCPPTMIFDIKGGKEFPLLTKKKVNFNAIVKELLWFLSGSTNINDLDSKIWNAWSNEDGDVGPMYGHHFRKKNGRDPFMDILNSIRNNPDSRRHVMTTWDHSLLPDEKISPQENVNIGKQALANCHGTTIQFFVRGDYLDMYHYQRSSDCFLGLPFNIASYSLLLMIVSAMTHKKSSKVYFQTGDTHIYKNHIEQVREYIDRDYLHQSPSVTIDDFGGIPDFCDIHLHNYEHQPFIKAPISV